MSSILGWQDVKCALTVNPKPALVFGCTREREAQKIMILKRSAYETK